MNKHPFFKQKKIFKISPISILFLYFLIVIPCYGNNYKIFSPQCEYLTNPIGIDSFTPRLTWSIAGKSKLLSSCVCQLWIDKDSLSLANESVSCWKSGELPSTTTLISYQGEKLKSNTRYFWKVIYHNGKGEIIVDSPISYFETGFLDTKEWKGNWISDNHDKNYKTAPYFRKNIRIDDELKEARIYLGTAGLQELFINGKRVGNHQLDPMYTQYDKRNLYVSYDVTSFLHKNINTVGILLGNGWYNHQSTAVWLFDKAVWRNRPKFIINILLRYKNGKEEWIASDDTWKTMDSPVIFNSIYTAEHYDANKEIPNWNIPEYDDSNWSNAQKVEAPSHLLKAQLLQPIRVTDVLNPTKMDKKNNTHYIFHFPRNIAGIVQLKVKGEQGTTLRLKHGEMLAPNGTVNTSNIDYHYRPIDNSDPFQTDIVKLSGREDCFSPKFNYKGFQYVEISASAPIELSVNNLQALEMHSDVPSIGHIHSSSDILNKIYEATNSSYLANLFGYPTDCPQREKNGWTGDAHIAIETGLYNFDAITIYEKWLSDFVDAQHPDGTLPCIIPTDKWGFDWGNGVDWTSAIAIIPWQIYCFYGDATLLKRMYPNIKTYVEKVTTKAHDGLTDWGLGDWIPVKSKSNLTLTSSLYYYNDVNILAKAATLFGYSDDAINYNVLSKKIKDAINDKFLNKKKGIYCSGTQTELSSALFWGVVPEEYKQKVAEQLYSRVKDNNFHLDVGLLGTKTLLNALSQNGYADAAYKIVTKQDYPSWGYWIANGATTLHENWRIDVIKDNSLNHIMFGEVGAWMYKSLGGIYIDENQPGFKHILLKPDFVSDLKTFEATHKAPTGWISSKWERKGNKIIYNVTIPTNSTATFYPPKQAKDQTPINLTDGTHKLIILLSNYIQN